MSADFPWMSHDHLFPLSSIPETKITEEKYIHMQTCTQFSNIRKASAVKTIQYLKEVSVQFSRSVVSHSLRPHELQHARPPCPSPTPGVYLNSYPSSWWCHPAIWSSVVPFSSCPQSLLTSGSFPMSQLFAWGGQSIGFHTEVHPTNHLYL